MHRIRTVSIENYKSIRKLSFELGQLNVFIGANGSGKSNVLEAIALASADSRGKLDNEYIAPRGVRVTDPRFLRCALRGEEGHPFIQVKVERPDAPPHARHYATMFDPATWLTFGSQKMRDLMSETIHKFLVEWAAKQHPEAAQAERERITGLPMDPDSVRAMMTGFFDDNTLPEFVVYAPENSSLRLFEREGQILPLGSRGEGLFSHLKRLSLSEHATRIAEVADRLALLDWFERLEVPKDLVAGERAILIRDRYLAEGALFDQRSANEGFLFLLFYFTLLVSPETSSFFAVDNIETSLNPMLCTLLVKQLVELARKYDKQILLTTHSPAILDGLDLADDEQRLFVAERRKDGGTRLRRIEAPKNEHTKIRLSDAFIGGYLGGLPKNF